MGQCKCSRTSCYVIGHGQAAQRSKGRGQSSAPKNNSVLGYGGRSASEGNPSARSEAMSRLTRWDDVGTACQLDWVCAGPFDVSEDELE